MRLHKDGWKRCSKCHAAVMGLQLRIEKFGIPAIMPHTQTIPTSPIRLTVKWKSNALVSD
ncbi:MAG: hypothetical protein ACXV2C_03655 [Candidatus Bathyarchaeia archaeon]